MRTSPILSALRPSLLALPLLTLASFAGAAGTAAGTSITNKATADAQGENAAIHADSNEVETRVQEVCSVSVSPDGSVAAPGQRASVSSGGGALFAYKVVNTGNARFTLDLAALRDAASTAALGASDLRIYRDADKDGQLGAGDAEIGNLTLNPDDGANVLLAVTVPASVKGLAYVALKASCASGAADEDNVAELRIDGVARITLEKTFGAASVAPGGDARVTLRVKNAGNEAETDVRVTDLLNTPDLAGLRFVPASASAKVGGVEYTVEYTPDGAKWLSEEPQSVSGLRWTIPSLPEGADASLTFALRADGGAAVGERANVAALADAAGDALRARATVQIGAGPALALGPIHNPQANPGGELSDSDAQRRGGAAANQPACFAHTLQNTGNVADRVSLGARVSAGEADVTFQNEDGAPLAQPVPMAAGASLNFRACLTPRGAAEVVVLLTATSSAGAAQNSTLDRLGGIDARALTLVKTVDPAGTVTEGATLTYTLAVTNPYAFALSNVALRDALNPALEFVSASEGGEFQGGAVTWQLASLRAGATLNLHVVARVRDGTPDGETVENRFSLISDQTPGEQFSAPVETPVWSAALTVEKAVSAADAIPGDRLTYRIKVHNASPNAALRSVVLTDVMPAGLAYIPGSAALEGAPLADPNENGQTLTWALPDLAPGSEAILSYAARVLPGAGENLTNVASVRALGSLGNVVAAVASNVARAAVRVRAGVFDARRDVIGRVFVDRDRDGVYDEGADTPLERARVLLADGRGVLTDSRGRFHFANVGGPVVAARLDPNSVPYAARPMPQDGGLRGSRSALLTGLTSLDFPLEPFEAAVAVGRSTALRAPGFALSKTVARDQDGGYTVTLRLQADAPLADFELADPLPAGATLLEGRATLQGTLQKGETVLTYRFRLASPAPDAMTDPIVRWRSQ